MPAYYSSTALDFVATASDEIIGKLSTCIIQQFTGDHSRQLASWQVQVNILQNNLIKLIHRFPAVGKWGVLIEYPLLRLQKRLDVVILAGSSIIVIEFKVGATNYLPADIRQTEDYALDLRDFHEASYHHSIVPILCATEAPNRGNGLAINGGVTETCVCNSLTLIVVLEEIASMPFGCQIELDAWNMAAYRPVPGIVEAAELLFSGHQVKEIASASSDPSNLGSTTDQLIEIISRARQGKEHIVAFVTGVPGSGKTLVGLNAINDARFRTQDMAVGAFLSGNTPLVRVLQEALARDEAARTKVTLKDARRKVRSQIQGLMHYLEEYLNAHPDEAPVDHVILFDEAQRAWNAEYGAKKFNRQESEPALFLEIMGRHQDWGVIIALVGGGQEINRGEKGLSEWGAAIAGHNRSSGLQKWRVVAASDILEGSDATAWQTLFEHSEPSVPVERNESLHLGVSVRSYRCSATTQWVNALLDGNIDDAQTIAAATDNFPIYITRSLTAARQWLFKNMRGNRRSGLVATSGARRLRAEGLGVTLSAGALSEVANWYLLPPGDIRSSSALEVTANEYTCQGLELDYVGVCWGGDLIWDNDEECWAHRQLRGPKWQTVRDPDGQRWIRNKYRVLLTRSRLATAIWVPQGSADDDTRDKRILDALADQLSNAGAVELT